MGTLSYSHKQVKKLADTAKCASNQNRPTAHQDWLAAVALSTELLGPTNPQTSYCMFHAADALTKAHQGEEAIALLRPYLRQLEKIHGKSHYAVENIHQSLARAYKSIGLNMSQLMHWLAAAQSAEKRRGFQDSTVLYCYHNAARTYLALRLFDKALPLLVSILSATLAIGGPQIRLAYIVRDTANCLTLSERFEDALPLWQFAIESFENDPRSREVRQRAIASMRKTQAMLEQASASQ